MKICAVIAEYNPFHLGHLKQLNYIKNTLGAEKIVVVMSGNFTQRGEPAVLNKFIRAKEAVLSGADLVIELPTVFATGNAEIFAKGAIKIINDLGIVDCLCFGVESGTKEDYIALAKEMNDESKEFKQALKECLEEGVSLAKAKFNALEKLGKHYDKSLIASPNNVLGLEYTKALLSLKSDIEICPMLREGDHNDKKLRRGITSATSIREQLKVGKVSKIKSNVPKYVYRDLTVNPFPHVLNDVALASVHTSSAKELAYVLDCTEGLENRIKALSKDNFSLDKLVEKVTTKRYTSSRIRRIITANLLRIRQKQVFDCLESPTYAKILAVKRESKALISSITEKGKISVLTRKSDVENLKKHPRACFEIDTLANDLYSLACGERLNENQMLVIE